MQKSARKRKNADRVNTYAKLWHLRNRESRIQSDVDLQVAVQGLVSRKLLIDISRSIVIWNRTFRIAEKNRRHIQSESALDTASGVDGRKGDFKGAQQPGFHLSANHSASAAFQVVDHFVQYVNKQVVANSLQTSNVVVLVGWTEWHVHGNVPNRTAAFGDVCDQSFALESDLDQRTNLLRIFGIHNPANTLVLKHKQAK